jgi:thioredoxin-like negative regulator of GroEL
MAPTLQAIEQEYGDRVNFVMVNGDKAEAWPLIDAFGVDAIPHLAMVSAEGDVETALIGPIPKHVLKADIDILLANAEPCSATCGPKRALPYQMLDVFKDQPDGSRRVRFVEVKQNQQ